MSLTPALRRLMQADRNSRPIWSTKRVEELHRETMYQAKQAAGEVLLVASGSMKDKEGDFILGSTPDRTQE